jgi:type IV secretory pathway TraG/TraD family ATPase VirD4
MFGSARIANRKDLESLLTPHPNEQHVTRLGGVGLILELPCGRGTLGAEFGCTLCLSEELRNRHMLFVAKPGGGKTTRGILPLLLADIEDEERTVVSFETKGNHHPLIAHWTRRHRRKKPVVLNLTDPRRSVGWNPVRRDLTRTEAYDIAFTLCTAADRNSASQDSSFWINNAVRAMTGILLAIARDPDEQPCLGRVHEILDLSRDAFLAWSERNKDIPQIEFFRSFLRSNSHNAETCLADMSGRMATFLDMNLCATTSADELDLSTLTKQPTVLIVEIDEAQIEKLRPVYNLLFSRLLAALIDAADARPDGRLQRPVSIIADEFASAIGRIPDLPVRLNTMRSRRISFVAAVQSIGQIKHVYGDATESVLAAFNTRVFFPALELQDACYASALSGITTVENRVETSLFTEDWEAPSPTMRRSWTTSSIGRPLFLPGEISQPPTHFALGAPATFFLADTPPFQAWLTPSYQLPEVAFALRTIASARPASRKLRRKALAYAPRSKSTGSGRVPDKAVSAGFTDPSGLSEDRLRELLEEVLPRDSHFDDFEVERDFAGLGRRTMLLNGRRLDVDGGQEVDGFREREQAPAGARAAPRRGTGRSEGHGHGVLPRLRPFEHRQHPGQPQLPGLHAPEAAGRATQAASERQAEVGGGCEFSRRRHAGPVRSAAGRTSLGMLRLHGAMLRGSRPRPSSYESLGLAPVDSRRPRWRPCGIAASLNGESRGP